MRSPSLRAAAVAAFLALEAVFGPATLHAQPIVPFCASFTHWDHHWFIWLPRDPDFEAVEIHSQDARTGAAPLVWVYFTERQPPKRQVNFVNDETLARLRGWMFRDIGYEIRNRPGTPRGVDARFSDDKGRAIFIAAEFVPEMPFSARGAGVTDQMGHGADGAFLLLYRQATAEATSSKVLISGVDVSAQLSGGSNPLPFHAAYSPNTFNAAILFRDCHVTFDGASAGKPPSVLAFAEQKAGSAGARRFTARRGELEFELVTDAEGATERYSLRRPGHAFTAAFNPPLGGAGGNDSWFSLSLDGLQDLVGGRVAISASGAGRTLHWRPESPVWTRGYAFQTRLRPSGDNSLPIDGRSMRAGRH